MERQLIIICEDCGRKYRVDTEKILGRAAGFSCYSCGHRIRVAKPASAGDPPVPEVAALASMDEAPDSVIAVAADGPREPVAQTAGRQSEVSLITRMLLLLLVVPVVATAAVGFLFLDQLDGLVVSLNGQEFLAGLLMLAGIFLVLLAVGVGYCLRIAGRIRRLAEEAERLSLGETDVRISVSGEDDLSRLAAALARLQGVLSAPERRESLQ